MSIEVSNLVKSYGDQKAVNEISFKVGKAEIVGFLGPNGAGKSTTMKIITGYLPADSGSVQVCGLDVNPQSISSKKKVGYLPEANPLYYEMYVREYLRFMAGIHEIGKNKKERIEEVISLTGLVPESKKKLGQLSKGYKQRAGLAAALLHDPEVLILDEPTSGLDPNQIIEIREVIKNLGKNKTVLFSSHILQEVEAICERVIIINKGKIVADNKLSALQKTQPGNEVVKVEFKEKTDPSLLSGLQNVNQLQQIADNRFSLITNDSERLRNELMSLSLNNNLNIVSLHTETNSLEDVFRELTSGTNR